MCKAGFFLTRLARESLNERIGLARYQRVQGGFHFLKAGKLMEPVGAGGQFAGGLRPAQHQDAQEGQFGLAEVHHFGEDVFVFGHPTGAAIKDVSQILLAQCFQRPSYRRLVVRSDRRAIVFLIARQHESVKRQRVILGRSHLFFDQGAEDAHFNVG